MKNHWEYLPQLLRLKQWAKNLFIFFPLIFASKLFDFTLLKETILTFLAFGFVASGIYIINDLMDIAADKVHPKKSQRPLAQNKFTPSTASFLSGGLLLAGLLLTLKMDLSLFLIALTYIAVHLVYNWYAKKIVLIDVMFVAIGFHIRIWAGATSADVIPSEWLQTCVFILALFLGFTKRRHEISSLKEKAVEHRDVFRHYTPYMLDQLIIICSTLAITFYSLYCFSSGLTTRIGNQNMVYSLIFVIYGIFRYLYLVHVKKQGDDPGDVIFSDPPLLINLLLWVTYVTFAIYSPL